MDRTPIFFAWTRSFWLGIFPALLTALDLLLVLMADSATSGPVAKVLSILLSVPAAVPGFDWLAATPEQIGAFMQALAPIYALIVGHQRAGAARPYTIDPRMRE